MYAVTAPHFEHGSLGWKTLNDCTLRVFIFQIGGGHDMSFGLYSTGHSLQVCSVVSHLTITTLLLLWFLSTWGLWGLHKFVIFQVNTVIPAMLITQGRGEREKRYGKWESFANIKRYCLPLCYWHDAPFIFIFKNPSYCLIKLYMNIQ